jgi:hypothetical protein
MGEDESSVIAPIDAAALANGKQPVRVIAAKPQSKQMAHMLISKLMAEECYISGKEDVGRKLVLLQDFFDRNSREIIDESDENFSINFEISYTTDMQRCIELSPDRGLLLQGVLDLVRVLAPPIAKELSRWLEYLPNTSAIMVRVTMVQTLMYLHEN